MAARMAVPGRAGARAAPPRRRGPDCPASPARSGEASARPTALRPCARVRPGDGVVHTTAWGSGADWALDSLPAMLGARLCRRFLSPGTPRRREAAPCTPAPARATDRTGAGGAPARGDRAEGDGAGVSPPTAASCCGVVSRGPDRGAPLAGSASSRRRTLAGLPSSGSSWGVDGARSRTVVGAARRAEALERTTAWGHEEADRALRSLPGVGVTSAGGSARAHGDADALSGDYHVAQDIGFALTGSASTTPAWPSCSNRSAAPVPGAAAGGARRDPAPRRGPRMAPRTHLPVRT